MKMHIQVNFTLSILILIIRMRPISVIKLTYRLDSYEKTGSDTEWLQTLDLYHLREQE